MKNESSNINELFYDLKKIFIKHKKVLLVLFLIIVLVPVLVLCIFNVLKSFSDDSTLSGRANTIEISDGNIAIVTEESEEEIKANILNLRAEFDLLCSNEEYEECAKILNGLNCSGIAVLLTDAISETREGNLQLYTESPKMMFDKLTKIGWSNICWSSEIQDCFFKTMFVYGSNDKNGKSEAKRMVFIKQYLDLYSDLPKEIEELISLTDNEEWSAELFRKNILREKAYERAVSELKPKLKHPASLDVHYEWSTAKFNLDEGYIKVTLDYSATNSFGGMVRDKFSYTYTVDPIYMNWNFKADAF